MAVVEGVSWLGLWASCDVATKFPANIGDDLSFYRRHAPLARFARPSVLRSTQSVPYVRRARFQGRVPLPARLVESTRMQRKARKVPACGINANSAVSSAKIACTCNAGYHGDPGAATTAACQVCVSLSLFVFLAHGGC